MASFRGRCLCGAVRFEVDGPLDDVLLCHCGECRRWAGHVWASASAKRADLSVTGDALRWIDSPESETNARRAFCAECGSSLFWEAPGRDTIAISAGALEAPTGLKIEGDVYTEYAGDYY